MAKAIGLTRDDSAEIGFVLSSLFSSAIDIDELHQWTYKLLEDHEVDDLPPYIFDLMEFEGPLAKVYKLVGFVPSWGGTEEERAALFGIAVKRKRERYEWPIPPEEALRALERNPALMERFRKTFPFLRF